MNNYISNNTIVKNFWVFEGLDGAGTTTQLKILSEELGKMGRKVFKTAEPTGTETGLFLRKILSGDVPLRPSTLAYLFAADRDNHINGASGIIEHLNKGEIVLSDRYLFSSLAYQSMNVPYSTVKTLNSFFPLPELVIYIDLPAGVCINRINSRGERKEIFEKLDIQKKVQSGYDKALSDFSSICKIVRIDGNQSIEAVAKCVLEEAISVLD